MAPANLPTCEAGVNGISVRDLAAHVGQRVSVRGTLVGGVALLGVGCPVGCCTSLGAGSLTIDSKLALTDAGNPHAFECGGDDSITCCGFEIPGRDVVAVGMLNETGDTLSHVSLCVLRLPGEDVPAPSCNEASSEPGPRDGPPCACYGGHWYCEWRGCFRSGRWLDDGAELPVSQSCSRCRCDGREWKCEPRPCSRSVIDFPPRSAKISAQWAERLRHVLFSGMSGVRLEITGLTAEGEEPALAGERARNLARVAEQGGVPRERVEVRVPSPAARPSIAPLTTGGVELLVFEVEPPEIPVPTPPE